MISKRFHDLNLALDKLYKWAVDHYGTDKVQVNFRRQVVYKYDPVWLRRAESGDYFAALLVRDVLMFDSEGHKTQVACINDLLNQIPKTPAEASV